MEALLSYALQQWHVIAGAPEAFAVCVLVVAGITWFFARGQYTRRIETLSQHVEFLTARLEHAGIPAPSSSEGALPVEMAPAELIDFAIDRVYPAWTALQEIQRGLIARECRNTIIQGFANAGIVSNPAISTFAYGLEVMDRFGTSPPQPVTKAEIIGFIHALETGYQAVRDQTQLLAIAAGVSDVSSHPDFAPLFEKWRQKHNAMVAAYEPIKRNPTYDRLFRPVRPSRWGEPILVPTAVPPGPEGFLEPE
jgi:hypothetical protein